MTSNHPHPPTKPPGINTTWIYSSTSTTPARKSPKMVGYDVLLDDEELVWSALPRGFDLFNSLPVDIRVMVWDLTFPYRVLAFHFPKYKDEEHLITSTWDINPNARTRDAVPESEKLFAKKEHIIGPRGILINNSLPLPRLVSAGIFKPVVALSVCRESRDFALRVGYRPWELKIERKSTTAMWNPLYDTIFLEERFESVKEQPLFVLTEKFKRQFRIQAQELRSLAVYTSHWNQKETNQEIQEVMVEKWMGFRDLTKIIAVMDVPYERQRANIDVRRSTSPVSTSSSQDGKEKKIEGFLFPVDIENGLHEGKEAREEWSDWPIPRVTLVDKKHLMYGFTGGMKMLLRCTPCPALKEYVGIIDGRSHISSPSFIDPDRYALFLPYCLEDSSLTLVAGR